MTPTSAKIAIIGAGPAGLIAADYLSQHGFSVTLFDRMAQPGRKFLMAGRGGLNLTHSEALPRFLARYGAAEKFLAPLIAAFTPSDLRDWAEALGQETFVGSSGRIFPKSMKASPLLRAWLKRLAEQGVALRGQMTWLGWTEDDQLLFRRSGGDSESVKADAVLLALGGASWPRLGSDGGWAEILAQKHIGVAPLRPANCGFTAGWSPYFRDHFQGQPLKGAAFSCSGRSVRGEAMIAAYGIEGGAIYALSATLRDQIAALGGAELIIDFCPDRTLAAVREKLSRPRGAHSLSNHLRRALGLPPIAITLLRESAGIALPQAPEALAMLIKACPISLTGTAPIARAISTAGGIHLDEVGPDMMLRKMPGCFVAGEMLDWEAPTGGYLLQAVFATGMAAAQGIERYLVPDAR